MYKLLIFISGRGCLKAENGGRITLLYSKISHLEGGVKLKYI